MRRGSMKKNLLERDGDAIRIHLGGRKGLVATIDARDEDEILDWYWGVVNGYAEGQQGRSARVYLHRLITGADSSKVVDHIDGDPMNNRRSNLRVTTQLGNGTNRRNLNKNNRSGYRGVYYSTTKRRWIAQIKVNYRPIKVGQFQTAEEAARAYDKAAKEFHGSFATLNFPDTRGIAQLRVQGK